MLEFRPKNIQAHARAIPNYPDVGCFADGGDYGIATRITERQLRELELSIDEFKSFFNVLVPDGTVSSERDVPLRLHEVFIYKTIVEVWNHEPVLAG